jgi:hypothetical protein
MRVKLLVCAEEKTSLQHGIATHFGSIVKLWEEKKVQRDVLRLATTERDQLKLILERSVALVASNAGRVVQSHPRALFVPVAARVAPGPPLPPSHRQKLN